jgi:hypothetical protein
MCESFFNLLIIPQTKTNQQLHRGGDVAVSLTHKTIQKSFAAPPVLLLSFKRIAAYACSYFSLTYGRWLVSTHSHGLLLGVHFLEAAGRQVTKNRAHVDVFFHRHTKQAAAQRARQHLRLLAAKVKTMCHVDLCNIQTGAFTPITVTFK